MNILKRWFTPKIEENIDNGQNPWAGLASYEDPAIAEHKLKFCGRDDDSYDVAKLIMGNTFVTLYGKSGIGKTSLLNAGVFPELREEHYTPFSLRLGMRDENNPQSYQTIIIEAVKLNVQRIEDVDVMPVQDDQLAVDYLWKYFACHRFYDKNDNPIIPIVVLDQFEEVFRYNRKEVETLLRQLDNCAVNGSSRRYNLNVHFVVSIREDDLYRLEDAIDNCYLPTLKRCRYRLRSLSEQGAYDAILIPGEGLFSNGEKEQIAQSIIRIARNKEDNSISTNILSLVCNRLYVECQDTNVPTISLSLVDSFVKGNPFERFYNEATHGFSNREKLYIEENLVDSTGRRNSIPESNFMVYVKNGARLIEGKNRILQRTSTSYDGQNYRIELIHDSFCEPLVEMKNKRLQKKKLLMFLLLTIIVILCGSILFFIRGQYNQNWELMKTEARYIASQAERLIDDGDSYMAQRLLLEVLPLNIQNQNRPYVVEAGNALLRAINSDYTILDKVSECEPCFSSNGSYVFSASGDSIKMLDIKTGKLMRVFYGSFNIDGIKIFPDGELILFYSNDSRDRCVTIMHIRTAGALTNIIQEEITPLEICPTGDKFAITNDSIIQIWDLHRGRTLFTLKHSYNISSICFNSKGNMLLSASYDGTIVIWDIIKGRKYREIECGDNVLNAFFSADGKYIISRLYDSSYNSYIKIWKKDNKSVFQTIKRVKNSVVDVAYASQYNSLICTFENGEIDMIDLAKTNPVPKKIIETKEFTHIWPSSKGNYFVISSNESDSIKVLSAKKDGLILAPLGIKFSNIRSISFSPDEREIIVQDENVLKLFDIERVMQNSENGRLHEENVALSSYSQDGKYIATTTDNCVTNPDSQNIIKIWDRNKKILLFTLKGHTSVIHSLAFSHNGKFLVSTSKDATMKIWDIQTGNLLRSMEKKGNFKVLDPKTKQRVTIFDNYSPVIVRAVFNKNDNEIITISNDGVIANWNLSDGNIISSIESYRMAKGSLCLSQTGKIVSLSDDESINIWDSNSKRLITKCKETMPNAIDAVFSPDEKQIAVLFKNGKLGIWDSNNGDILFMIDVNDNICSLSFSMDGKQILSITEDGQIFSKHLPSLQDIFNSTFKLYNDYRLNQEEKKTYYLK